VSDIGGFLMPQSHERDKQHLAPTIEFRSVSKAYRDILAVDDLSATALPGRVTGFLGPNGAGKSTALRCLLGLATPTSGWAGFGNRSYQELPDPLLTVGAVLDSRGFHPGLTGRESLLVAAAAAGIPDSRVQEVLALVDLEHATNKRVKSYSLGMTQRLAIAAALLGDPHVLVLDEPANGLDPIGIVWLRDLLRSLANFGKTVLVSSHQLAEMQHTIDDVLILNHGKLIASGPIEDVRAGRSLEDAFLTIVGARA
jgi:ABC-2 type transport system ATP-binding protein